MAKKTKVDLKRDGMGIIGKVGFTVLFFMMGFAILGAGLRGQAATAPIVMTIGMLMILIGLAPYYVKILYAKMVPQDASLS